MLPYYSGPKPEPLTPEQNLRLQVNLAQDNEIAKLILVNQFLRSEIKSASEGRSKFLVKKVGI